MGQSTFNSDRHTTKMSKLSIALTLLVVFAVSIQATQTCQEKCAGNAVFVNDKMCVRNCRNNERLPSDKQGRFGGETFDAEAFVTNAGKALSVPEENAPSLLRGITTTSNLERHFTLQIPQ